MINITHKESAIMFNSIFSLSKSVFVSLVLFTGMACVAASTTQENTGNPVIKLMTVLNEVKDSHDSFEELESKLDAITPRECKVDETVVTADEIKFMILIFKLETAVNLSKVNKTIKYVHDLEKLLASAKLDFKKLAALFDGLDFEALLDIDIPAAYIVAGCPEKVIERVQSSLEKYKKGSREYAMLKFTLGMAFMKMTKHELATAPLEYAFDYFKDNGPDSYAALCASNLNAAYTGRGDKANSDKYSKIADDYAKKTSSTMVVCQQKMVGIIQMLDCSDSDWEKGIKEKFENNRNFIIAASTSDLQLFITYCFSAIIRLQHNYSENDIMSDLEKAFAYRAMIWGDAEVGEQVKQIDDILSELKEKLIQGLAETNQIERANYWNAKFEKTRQRSASLESAAKSSSNKNLLPLLALVTRYENAEQILKFEEAKKAEERDKRLIQRATLVKRELEQQFDAARKNLSAEELKIFNAFLADNFVIHPDSLGQLSAILPPGVACVQFLPVGEKIVVYVVVNGVVMDGNRTILDGLVL